MSNVRYSTRMDPNSPYRIDVMHDHLNERVKGGVLLLFFLVFQFSGGVYLPAVARISGELSLLHEDVMMAGYASMVGMCLTFTIMYRLKAFYTVKSGIICSAAGLIVCNIINLYTSSVPLLVGVSFVAGVFRLWGTFACNSTLARWIFPQWSMPKFMSYIQTSIMSFMSLSGLTTVYLSYYIQWRYMHLLMVGVLLLTIVLALILFTHHRPIPKLPLYGIDWMGALLWACTALSIIFVLNYGEYYDWFYSFYIRSGMLVALLTLGLNLWRASFVRHPYISNQMWKARNVRISLLLLVASSALLSPSQLFERILTSSILHYDDLTSIALSWWSLAGYILGGCFTLATLGLRGWTHKRLISIAFSLIFVYLLFMYVGIDYNLPKEALYMPVIIRSAGAIIITITIISAIFKSIHFQYFFQALNMTTIVASCCAPLLCSSIVSHIFKQAVKVNVLGLSSTLDGPNISVHTIPMGALYSLLQQQSLLVSMKAIYGWLTLSSMVCLLLFFLRESDLYPAKTLQKVMRIPR